MLSLRTAALLRSSRRAAALAPTSCRAIALAPASRRLSTLIVDEDDDDDDEQAVWSSVRPSKALLPGKEDSFGLEGASALGRPVMTEGVYNLKFSVRGDAVVGVAASAKDAKHEWSVKAWGVGTATGCLHHAFDATDEGMPGIELAPQRQTGDATERLIDMELDLDESRMRLRSDDGAWRNVPVRLPPAVQPWALIPEHFADDAVSFVPTVRLLSCVAQPVGLQQVDGLEALVGTLGAGAQRRALNWCTREDIYDAATIEVLGLADAFVTELNCRADEARDVRRRLEQA